MWHKDKVLVCTEDIANIIPIGGMNVYWYRVKMKDGKAYNVWPRAMAKAEMISNE